MKSPITGNPRFVCRIARGWNSLVGGASAAAGEVNLKSGHVKNCGDCQRYYRASSELEATLRLDARRQSELPPEGLDRRIVSAIAFSARATRRSYRRIAGLAFAGGAAAVALAIFFLQAQRPGPATHRGEIRGVTSNTTGQADFGRIWESLPSPAENLLDQNPLQDEVDAVYSNARSAVRFLAMNFLPTAPDSDQGTREKRRPGAIDG